MYFLFGSLQFRNERKKVRKERKKKHASLAGLMAILKNHPRTFFQYVMFLKCLCFRSGDFGRRGEFYLDVYTIRLGKKRGGKKPPKQWGLNMLNKLRMRIVLGRLGVIHLGRCCCGETINTSV